MQPKYIGLGLILALAATKLVDLPALVKSVVRAHGRVQPTTVPVRRMDLEIQMTTGGTVSSSEQTIIQCELEGGETTILSVLPEGTTVKKGDILCELDSAAFQEQVRIQQINVGALRSTQRQAELSLEVARLAVEEFKGGLMQQTIKSLKAQRVLCFADRQSALDRLRWSERLLEKGYVARSAVSAAEYSFTKVDLDFKRGQTALELFELFTGPRTLKVLTSGVLSAKSNFEFETLRLKQSEDRLAFCQRQVQHCTIRAPHNGFLTYMTTLRSGSTQSSSYSTPIEPGMAVRRRQSLFYLPDLDKMEVAALLHQTIVKHVRPGMPARIRVEGFPEHSMEGQVTTIAQLPTTNTTNRVSYFLAAVKLQSFPPGLKPGMTAEVVITTGRRPGALVIPSECWSVEEGKQVCYVAHEGRVERREIEIGQASRNLLEVLKGLAEGEQVLLHPGGDSGVASQPKFQRQSKVNTRPG
jgi:HlyD family secretion protein